LRGGKDREKWGLLFGEIVWLKEGGIANDC
jgi:hypothetical protein